MNKKIIDHVTKVCVDKGWPIDTDEDLFMAVMEGGKGVYRKEVGSHRWWNDVFYVSELEGMKIGYFWADTTGDNNAQDCGWEPDYSELFEVEEKTETKVIITYHRIEDE